MERDPAPPDEWNRRLGNLKRVGRQFQGPCPACGGTDRFRVTIPDGRFFCRQCCPDGSHTDAMKRILQAAGFESPFDRVRRPWE